MLNTYRYEIVDGKRVFTRFDRLNIDPMGTQKHALETVDRSEYLAAVERLRSAGDDISFGQWRKLNAEVELARRRYRIDLLQHMRANPVHFHPRRNEGVICPLLVFHG